MYSAISYQGQKLYKLARAGIEIAREPRDIFIHKLIPISYTGDRLLIDVECSKGTFIRTLTEDIAASLHMVGTMEFLLRKRVGNFLLADAYTLEEIEQYKEQCMLPLEMAIENMPVMTVNTLQGTRIAHGVPTTVQGNLPTEAVFKVVTETGSIIGIAESKNGKIYAKKIINIPEEVK